MPSMNTQRLNKIRGHFPLVKGNLDQGSRCRSPVAPNAKILNKWLQNLALANLLATSNIYERFLKDLKLNITNMCPIG